MLRLLFLVFKTSFQSISHFYPLYWSIGYRTIVLIMPFFSCWWLCNKRNKFSFYCLKTILKWHFIDALHLSLTLWLLSFCSIKWTFFFCNKFSTFDLQNLSNSQNLMCSLLLQMMCSLASVRSTWIVFFDKN